MPTYIARVLIALPVILGACVGGPVPPSSVDVAGQWEIVGQSEQIPGKTTVLEANLEKNSADTLFATAANVVVLQQTSSLIAGTTLSSVGFACDNDILGNEAFNATFFTNTEANFAITDNGVIGSEFPTGNVAFNSAGTQIISGNYNVPPACGTAQDSGFVTGTKIAPFNGTFAGMLNSGGDALIVNVNEDASTFSVQVTGTDNGASIHLTGKAVGGTFTATGQGPTGPLSFLAVYDPRGNDFLVYGVTTFDFLGQLKAGTTP
jgi:hypothetical protein